MTTTDSARTVDQQARQATRPPAPKGGAGRLGPVSRWSRFTRSAPILVWVIAIRLATVLLAYLLILATALNVIPMLGAYLHQQSGTSLSASTASGAVALWLVPFLFVTTMVTVAQLALLRWIWRAGSSRIEKIKGSRPETHPLEAGRAESFR